MNNPKWENLASAIGNQYIREGTVFAPNVKEGGFFWEMLKTQPRGHFGHFAHRDGPHQQSEHDQSDLRARRAPGHRPTKKRMAARRC